MRKIQWRSKQTVILITITGLAYLLLRVQTYNFYSYVVLPRVQPHVVWEFVADFSNVKYLNPTITGFNVESESGNYDHWKYSVRYTENLSHWPYLYNEAVANFDIKPGKSNDVYHIMSDHKTCLFLGSFCLISTSEFKFSKTGISEVMCEETVNYECPTIMHSFCAREVEYQRLAIMRNLEIFFRKKSK